jgi:hypothetical protein
MASRRWNPSVDLFIKPEDIDVKWSACGASTPTAGRTASARNSRLLASIESHDRLPSSSGLSRAVEDDPYGEVIGECLESVGLMCSRVEHGAWADRMELIGDPKRPLSRRDDVDFIAVVRSLWILALGRIEAQLEIAVDKYLGRAPTVR